MWTCREGFQVCAIGIQQVHRGHGSLAEPRSALDDEGLETGAGAVHEPSAEPGVLAGPRRHFLLPLLFVQVEQGLLSPGPFGPLRIIAGPTCQGALNADEFGAVRMALIVEPVGEHQAVAVVVRLGEDGLHPGLDVHHGEWGSCRLGYHPMSCMESCGHRRVSRAAIATEPNGQTAPWRSRLVCPFRASVMSTTNEVGCSPF